MSNTASSMETVWAVRDARGLNANEKTFLYTVASRGVMKTCRETALEDMGFKKDTFYKVVKSLKAKEVIIETPGQYNPVSNKRDQTYYEINLPALQDSVWQTQDSVSQNDDSVSQKEDSVEPDNKVTEKVTTKVTVKETNYTASPVGEQEDDQSSLDPSLSTFEEIINPLHSWGVDILTTFIDSHGDMPSPSVETTSSPLVEDSAERAVSKKAEEDRRLEDYRGLPRHLKSEYDRKQRNERQHFDHDAFMAYSKTPVGMEEW